MSPSFFSVRVTAVYIGPSMPVRSMISERLSDLPPLSTLSTAFSKRSRSFLSSRRRLPLAGAGALPLTAAAAGLGLRGLSCTGRRSSLHSMMTAKAASSRRSRTNVSSPVSSDSIAVSMPARAGERSSMASSMDLSLAPSASAARAFSDFWFKNSPMTFVNWGRSVSARFSLRIVIKNGVGTAGKPVNEW